MSRAFYNDELVDLYFYHTDALGSVIAMTDSYGYVVEKYRYTPFGRTSIYDGSGNGIARSAIGNPYMFTARRMDEESGLYYYRARMYNPELGVFQSQDPLGYIDSMNLYAYCANNPLNYTDPWGENALGGVISWLSGTGFDTSVDMGSDEASQVGEAAAEGAGDGVIILADAYTFGWIPPLNSAADEKVCKNGNWGKASRVSANVSAAATYAATGMKWAKTQPYRAKIGLHGKHHKFNGVPRNHIQATIYKKGVKGSHTNHRWPYGK